MNSVGYIKYQITGLTKSYTVFINCILFYINRIASAQGASCSPYTNTEYELLMDIFNAVPWHLSICNRQIDILTFRAIICPWKFN